MKQKRAIGVIIILLVILVVIGATSTYLYYKILFKSKHPGFERRNFPINESQIKDVTSFFNATANLSEIKSYCNNNRVSCFYYCRSINQNHEICKELGNYTRSNYIQKPGGMPNGITN